MKNKTEKPFLLFSILIGVLLTISIGYSIWLITERVEIKPDLEVEKVITQYLSGQKTEYKPNVIQLPGAEALGWSQDSTDLTYSFKLDKDSNGNPVADKGYTLVTDEVGPIDAGTYWIKVEYQYSTEPEATEEVVVSFIINKATIDMKNVKFKDVDSETNIKTVIYDTNKHMVEIDQTTLPKEIKSVTYKLDDERPFDGAIDAYDNTNPQATSRTYNVIASFELEDAENYFAVDYMTATLIINRKNINDEDVTKAFIYHPDNIFYYTGKDLDIAGELTISIDKHTLTEKTDDNPGDYIVSFTNIIDVGDYSEMITGVGNFIGETIINYSIVKSKLVITLSENSSIYDSAFQRYFFEYGQTNDEDFKQYITVKNSQNELITNSSISYKYRLLNETNYANAGLPANVNQYWVLITATHPDYESGTKEIQLKINYIDISDGTITLEENNLIYTGSEQTVGIASVVHNGKELKLNTDYNRINYTNNINATGTTNSKKASVTISGTGNYTGSLTVYYDIAPATPIVYAPVYSTDKIVEGETLSATTDGYAIYNGVKLDDVGVIRAGFNTVSYPADSNSLTEKVIVTFTFISNLNSNGVYNYTQATATKEFTMYAVAKNGTTGIYYGTIEKALNSASTSQKVWVLPDIYTSTGFYPTVRTSAENKTVTIKEGVSLVLSYASEDFTTGYKVYSDGEAWVSESEGAAQGNAAQAKVAENIILKVDSGGILTVGAFVNPSCAVGKHAVLMNDGIINVEDNAEVHAYGYIKGTGKLNAKSGANVYDLLRVYDFAGARYAAGMFYKTYNLLGSKTYNNIMPFQSYSMHNISCELKINTGSKYYTRSQFNVSNTIYVNNVIMFGTGGMFELTTNNGYVIRNVEDIKGVTDINGNWSTSNQDIYQKEVYEFHSNIKDNSITVNLQIDASILEVPITITTGRELAMPIGMMDITIKSGYSMTINTNSFKFLPGSKVTIEKDATLSSVSDVNVIFYEEYYDDFIEYNSSGNAVQPSTLSYYHWHKYLYNNDNTVKSEFVSKLIVNGTLKCDGGFGGIIESTYIDEATGLAAGKVELGSGYGTLNRLKSIKYLENGDLIKAGYSNADFGGVIKQDKQSSKMKLVKGIGISSEYSSVAAGTYYAKAIGSKIGWYAEELDLTYDLNGGSGNPPNSQLGLPAGSKIKEEYLVSSGIEREYFTFGGWYTDPSCDERYKAEVDMELYSSTVLYAKWNPVSYDIEFSDVYINISNPSGSSNAVSENYECKFNYLTYDSFPDDIEHSSEYVLRGYFLDEQCTIEAFMIDGKLFIDGVEVENSDGEKVLKKFFDPISKKIKIYLQWYPKDTKFYYINYVNEKNTSNYDNAKSPATAILSNENNVWSSGLLTFTNADNDPSYQYYFDGWYLTEDYTGDRINTLTIDLFGSEYMIDLYAKWSVKNEIKVIVNQIEYGSTSETKKSSLWYKPGNDITIPSSYMKSGYAYTAIINKATDVTLGRTISTNGFTTVVELVVNLYTTLTVTYKVENTKDFKNPKFTSNQYVDTSTGKLVYSVDTNGNISYTNLTITDVVNNSRTITVIYGSKCEITASASGLSAFYMYAYNSSNEQIESDNASLWGSAKVSVEVTSNTRMEIKN